MCSEVPREVYKGRIKAVMLLVSPPRATCISEALQVVELHRYSMLTSSVV